MSYTTDNDGHTHVNIGSHAQTALGRFLNYYDPTPKRLPDGRGFNLFAGYYYYLITAERKPRLLRAQTLEDLKIVRYCDWSMVEDLERRLMEVLRFTIESSPMTLSMLVRTEIPIVWYEPDRELKQAEKRWLCAVQQVHYDLRQAEL